MNGNTRVRQYWGVVAISLAGVLALSACSSVGTAIGAGAVVGLAAAEERGIGGAAHDIKLRTEINDLWFKHDVDMFKALHLQIYEGRVLVSGTIEEEPKRDDAVRLAWQPPGVREVINEVEVRSSGGVAEFARDSWIVTRIKAKLLFTRQIDAINYSVESVGGTVYLIGLAQDAAELDRVLQVARTTPYVKKVVNYVLVKGDPRRKA